MENFMRISEASHFLGLCTDTIRNLERRGVIRCTRNAWGQRIFSRSELERLRQERERNGLCSRGE